MAGLRAPFQGVWNIVRFNWHFYVLALGLVLGLVAINYAAPALAHGYFGLLLLVVIGPLVVSLAASFYVYDVAGLYEFEWLPPLTAPAAATVLTINAGFDEASALLQAKLRPAHLLVFDFYDPARHTEVSIKRARAAYPPFPGTQAVSTRALPLPADAVDMAVAFLAAHEIRDEAERTAFFRELHRVLKPTGQLIVTEHLRDAANFLAYTIGFLHFHSRPTWLATFRAAGLVVEQELKLTPLITTFVLRKRGITA